MRLQREKQRGYGSGRRCAGNEEADCGIVVENLSISVEKRLLVAPVDHGRVERVMQRGRLRRGRFLQHARQTVAVVRLGWVVRKRMQ